jgi:hypothetical protein
VALTRIFRTWPSSPPRRQSCEQSIKCCLFLDHRPLCHPSKVRDHNQRSTLPRVSHLMPRLSELILQPQGVLSVLEYDRLLLLHTVNSNINVACIHSILSTIPPSPPPHNCVMVCEGGLQAVGPQTIPEKLTVGYSHCRRPTNQRLLMFY